MKHAQGDAMRGLEFIEQFDQCNLGAIQLPVAGENAAVFVAV